MSEHDLPPEGAPVDPSGMGPEVKQSLMGATTWRRRQEDCSRRC